MSNECSNFKKTVTVFLKTEITFLNKTKLFHFKGLEEIITGQQNKSYFYEGTLKLANFLCPCGWRLNELQLILYKQYIAGFKLYLISEN